ncbi:hypothetical protein SDC9_185739 [bioreactor metagenome]|uniref:Uncharacterized protein n=1 Tax=bioreactor metagenome TaxID=1076179 RepID=A0A645HGP4_9ZZZZ
MTLNPQASLGAYGPMFNIALIFLFISVTLTVAVFAYKKHCAKESQEAKSMDEAERKIMTAEKEREKARRIEETGYSERDERAYDEDSDDSE